MGKSTISMAIFNSKLLNYQRVIQSFITTNHYEKSLDRRIDQGPGG